MPATEAASRAQAAKAIRELRPYPFWDQGMDTSSFN